jgi:hypothetical protein
VGAIKVVLYAEGAGEAAGEFSLLPPPGDPLLEEHLGAAHLLVRRCIVDLANVPEGAVGFVSPLRLGVRPARGSDLLDRRSLRRLLTWPRPDRHPDFAVVLVDHDGDDKRRDQLVGGVADLPLVAAVGVAKQEFEAWLIADHRAVTQALGSGPAQPPEVEGLPRGKAKALLGEWIEQRPREAAKPREVRMTLARAANLDVLRRIGAFGRFFEDLRVAFPGRRL